MKRAMVMWNWVLLLSITVRVEAQQPAQQPAVSPANLEWPRVFVVGGATNTVYQPQVLSWDGVNVKARSAVSVQPARAPQPVYGVIEISAHTQVDKVQRLVYFDQFQLTSANFPSQPNKTAAYLQNFRAFLPREIKAMSLDRIEANLAILEEKKRSVSQPIRNDPPQIIFSSRPAMLVSIGGEPIYQPVAGTDLERIVNTYALVLKDKSGKHYLHFYDGFVEAPSLKGPWTAAASVPEPVKKAEQEAVNAKEVDLLAGQENPETKAMPSLKNTPVPELYLVTVPTELIVTTGEPQWAPIPSTQLLYVTNTTSHVFKNLVDQKTYVLLSGRWFRATSNTSPWEYVPGNALPKDFAAIPDNSSQENVKASVPGTRQAQEAIIANEIPQTTQVNRKETTMDPLPGYDTEPDLLPIEGTSLQYVANSETPVIKVDENAWYACQNGVWFVASSPNGPWAVADSVPAVIYSIPPNSPLHYVTYVRVYNSDPEYVWVGSTPGYYGTVAAPDGVVVYGTGYSYAPYIDDGMYVAYPITYGYAFNLTWTPWAGWAFGFAAGWAMAGNWNYWAYCPPAPYWGPYRYGCYGRYYNAFGGITSWGPYGWAGTSGYVYHQSGARSGVTRGAAGFNAWTGNQWATRYGRSYNSVTGVRTAGAQGSVNNVYTGRYASGGRGAAVRESSGAAVAGSRATVGGPNREATAARGAAYNPRTGQTTTYRGVRGDEGGVAKVNGQVVAAHDGNVYRGNGNGGWDNVTPPKATPYSAPAQRPPTQSFNNEAMARQQGAQRQASFHQHQPSFQGAPAGGFRGGGGGRRR